MTAAQPFRRARFRRQPCTAPTAEVVATVIERDRGCCAVCGVDVVNGSRRVGWSVQRRLRRRAGSTRRTWLDLPGNLIVVCGSPATLCHGRIEQYRLWAMDRGYAVPGGDTMPTEVGIEHAIYGLVYLLDDGSVSYDPPNREDAG